MATRSSCIDIRMRCGIKSVGPVMALKLITATGTTLMRTMVERAVRRLNPATTTTQISRLLWIAQSTVVGGSAEWRMYEMAHAAATTAVTVPLKINP